MSWLSQMKAPESAAARTRTFRFQSAGFTHRGKVRKLNEDALVQKPEAALWAVVDGMGGHNGGDLASALIAQRLSQIARADTAYALRKDVAEQLGLANEELLEEAGRRVQRRMGATVAVLTSCNGYYTATWAGDSRIYLLRKGRLRRITTDHSVIQGLVDAGEISPDEARLHARAHIVTRAIGAEADLLLETTNGELEPGDRFLLCSDGLTSVLVDHQIHGLIAGGASETAVEGLLRHALRNGAPDNVTAIVVDASCGQGDDDRGTPSPATL